MVKKIIVTTTAEIPGEKIKQIIGIARGNTVRTRNIGIDIGAGLKNLIGGELKGYTEMISQARDEASNRMVNQAIAMKADAVVNVRFMTSTIVHGASELLAYGTAVKLK